MATGEAAPQRNKSQLVARDEPLETCCDPQKLWGEGMEHRRAILSSTVDSVPEQCTVPRKAQGSVTLSRGWVGQPGCLHLCQGVSVRWQLWDARLDSPVIPAQTQEVWGSARKRMGKQTISCHLLSASPAKNFQSPWQPRPPCTQQLVK